MRDCCGIMVVNKPLIRPDLFWNINHLVSVHGATLNLFGFFIYELYRKMVVLTHLRKKKTSPQMRAKIKKYLKTAL